MSEEDDAYVQNLRDAFERYLSAVVRPLIQQNHHLKQALQAERKRAAEAEAALIDGSPKKA